MLSCLRCPWLSFTATLRNLDMTALETICVLTMLLLDYYIRVCTLLSVCYCTLCLFRLMNFEFWTWAMTLLFVTLYYSVGYIPSWEECMVALQSSQWKWGQDWWSFLSSVLSGRRVQSSWKGEPRKVFPPIHPQKPNVLFLGLILSRRLHWKQSHLLGVCIQTQCFLQLTLPKLKILDISFHSPVR